MSRFQLFDAVKLTETVPLDEREVAPAGTPGAVVEVLQEGEALMVELFARWVQIDAQGKRIAAKSEDPHAFMETLGVATVTPSQLQLVKPASETVGRHAYLLTVVEDLSERQLEEVLDFAEFLRQRQQRVAQP